MPTRRPARPDAGSQRVPAAVTRPTRTGVQVGAGYLIAQLLDTAIALSDEQVLLIALLLTPFISWVQVLIENRAKWGLLREVPPTDDAVDPLPVEGGYADPRLAIVLSIAALVLAVVALFAERIVIR